MSELNEYKKERQELIEARKFKTHVTGFEKGTPEVQNPMNLGEKLENFWYHYKYLVLSVAFILIVVMIVAWQFLSQPKYDISLTLVSKNSFEGGAELFEQKLAELGTDQNGDGKVLTDYAAFQLAVNQNTEMTPQMLEMTRATLLSRSSRGDLFLYLLDDTGYQQLTEVGWKFMDHFPVFRRRACRRGKILCERQRIC